MHASSNVLVHNVPMHVGGGDGCGGDGNGGDGRGGAAAHMARERDARAPADGGRDAVTRATPAQVARKPPWSASAARAAGPTLA